ARAEFSLDGPPFGRPCQICQAKVTRRYSTSQIPSTSIPAFRGNPTAIDASARDDTRVRDLTRSTEDHWVVECRMDSTELSAKAIIAAALITSHAVEVPALPRGGAGSHDPAAQRLRELTEYVYQALIAPTSV